MSAVGGLDCVHRESANGVGEAAVGRLHGSPSLGVARPPDSSAVRPRPLSGERSRVNACGLTALCVTDCTMDDASLATALDRAERALERVERALADRQPAPGRDEELRARVREAVAELDQPIREAAV